MLASREAIHLFAEIWMHRFQCNKAEPSHFFYHDFESWFGRECKFLGFELDTGIKFRNRLEQEKTAHSGQALHDLISHVYNWETLGSGLYSKWRYLTYWAGASLEETLPEEIEWFLLVLNQLYKSSAPTKKD